MLESLQLFLKKLLLPGPTTPTLELSYSRITTYRFCPWKYRLIYWEGQHIPPNPYISLGISIHKTLEEFHKNGHHDFAELIELYNQVWVNEGFHTPQQAHHFYERGERMLRQYFEWLKVRKSEIVAVEKDFSFQLGSRTLRGIIDRIDRLPDGSYEVIDYKTHAEMWEQSKIDSDLQLTLYAIGCKKVLHMEPVTLSYFFLAHNKFVTTHRTKLQEKEAIAEFEAVAEKIERDDFTPDTSKCVKCDFRQSCKFSTAKSAALDEKNP